ncbi:uncharacterized protein K444DRAFT_618802 [Hyaloscypha bicolor E]|uniref:Uncharacterized protein n=1 Tax=Hyaloscypha bicolor E TaxID=1095630 RepID=A0A2J6SS40_9HELO|nr:uncharacterized protein K444DRAFT_618802 [Hyaloscypha bicolor E]PMD53608.1 hypothetical protein K444DRAFT_618802 [Hyaloscypha bicolor E]
MEPVEILLLEEGDPNSGFRTKNVPGDKARAVLIDRGDALTLRAALVSVTHGDFTPNGDAATLLIFEFNFLSVKSARRFTSGMIILTFEDASGNVKNRPEVSAIAPAGSFAINKSTSTRDVHQTFNASIKGNAAGAGGDLGYVWDTSKVEETQHATTLVGMKRLFADFGKDNGVIWTLEEDKVKKQGIPSFLRAAVLLRRKDDVPFRFTISVDTGVDFEGKMRRLLGLEKPDPVDPVELDGETDLEDLGISSLDPSVVDVDLTNMRDMDIGKHADVVLATLLKVPA